SMVARKPSLAAPSRVETRGTTLWRLSGPLNDLRFRYILAGNGSLSTALETSDISLPWRLRNQERLQAHPSCYSGPSFVEPATASPRGQVLHLPSLRDFPPGM